MPAKKTVLKIILPVLVVALGFVAMRLLIMHRTPPQRQAPARAGALVEVLPMAPTDRQILVTGTGIVQVDREVTIVPQVSGRVVEMAPGLVAGGFFAAGELLFTLEAADYQLAVERAKAVLIKAEADLLLARGKARVARLEWERFNAGEAGEPNPLVVHEPQLQSAEAGVAAAMAGLRQAEMDLERTRVTAPFNCRIRAEQIGPGQYVKAGSSVATVAGTDSVEIVVPLELAALAWLAVPRPGGGEEGSPATVRLAMGTDSAHWSGRVVRSLGEVDEKSRMAKVVVRVRNPYGTAPSGVAAGPELMQGAFVAVEISGRALSGIMVVPRQAMRGENTVWVMDEDSQLRVRPVHVVHAQQEEVWIDAGLVPGERLILSALAGGAEGMQLRAIDKGAASERRD